MEYLVADCLIGIHGVSYVGVRNDLYLMSNDSYDIHLSLSSDLLLFEELVEYGQMLMECAGGGDQNIQYGRCGVLECPSCGIVECLQ